LTEQPIYLIIFEYVILEKVRLELRSNLRFGSYECYSMGQYYLEVYLEAGSLKMSKLLLMKFVPVKAQTAYIFLLET
jgi:hypothetical protein